MRAPEHPGPLRPCFLFLPYEDVLEDAGRAVAEAWKVALPPAVLACARAHARGCQLIDARLLCTIGAIAVGSRSGPPTS